MIRAGSRYSRFDGFLTHKSDEPRQILNFERSIPLQSGSFTHIVTEGDTLETIAYRYYKDSTRWWIIADANSMFNPLAHLTVGSIIQVPQL